MLLRVRGRGTAARHTPCCRRRHAPGRRLGHARSGAKRAAAAIESVRNGPLANFLHRATPWQSSFPVLQKEGCAACQDTFSQTCPWMPPWKRDKLSRQEGKLCRLHHEELAEECYLDKKFHSSLVRALVSLQARSAQFLGEDNDRPMLSDKIKGHFLTTTVQVKECNSTIGMWVFPCNC